jgi:hypothetical protein
MISHFETTNGRISRQTSRGQRPLKFEIDAAWDELLNKFAGKGFPVPHQMRTADPESKRCMKLIRIAAWRYVLVSDGGRKRKVDAEDAVRADYVAHAKRKGYEMKLPPSAF